MHRTVLQREDSHETLTWLFRLLCGEVVEDGDLVLDYEIGSDGDAPDAPGQ